MAPWRNQRGFGLVDLLVAFAMLMLVLAAVTTIHQGVLQAYVSGSNKAEVQQNARIALERVARELRQTPSALTSATATTLTLVDQDSGVAVAYAMTGAAPNATLTRTTAGVSSVVIGSVQALTFVYRDATEAVLAAPVATPANVVRVDITIQTASEDSLVAGGVADARSELTTSVRLRNL
jgi:Tfp pilus assembly protein PilW